MSWYDIGRVVCAIIGVIFIFKGLTLKENSLNSTEKENINMIKNINKKKEYILASKILKVILGSFLILSAWKARYFDSKIGHIIGVTSLFTIYIIAILLTNYYFLNEKK